MRQPIRRKKLSHEVSDRILNLIEHGEVPVGGQLPVEGDLVEMFNVSRTSVREAVKSLAAVGVLEIRPGIGTFVISTPPGPLRSLPGQNRAINRSDLLEILEFRCIFEPEAAALAAERATAADLVELLRCVEALEKGVEAGIRPPEDLGFHLALARATQNAAIADVSSLTVRFYEQDVYLPDALDVEGHREIYEAIASGNSEVARAAMIAHLEEIERRYHDYDPDSFSLRGK